MINHTQPPQPSSDINSQGLDILRRAGRCDVAIAVDRV